MSRYGRKYDLQDVAEDEESEAPYAVTQRCFPDLTGICEDRTVPLQDEHGHGDDKCCEQGNTGYADYFFKSALLHKVK
jgi:hypothetical protein